MHKARVKFNYHDYLHLPEEKRYELIEGDLYMVPSPSVNHQRVSRNIFELLLDHIRKNMLGEVLYAPCDVVLSDEDVFQPDILFVSKERSPIIKELCIKGPPDLVIEILSPSTAERDLSIKKKLYFKFGIKEYWVVDIEARKVEVMIMGEEGFETLRIFSEGSHLRSHIIKDLNIDVRNIFSAE